jgi:uncharacterized Ntn-hydrolase superfamily protein
VVATQAINESSYGPRCLDAIEGGASADVALDLAKEADPAVFLRQVGVVAADGSAATMTGEWCIEYAGHVLGKGFAVQANMMASPDVWPAMAEAYRTSTGSFPRRLLDALHAGQAAGGDARGTMSAALVVVDGEPSEPWAGRSIDLRVDRSDEPLIDLDRLLDTSIAFSAYHEGVAALFSGSPQDAISAVDRALARLPGDENMRFLRAGALAANGEIDRAHEELRALIAHRPSWETIVRSFATKGLLTLPPGATVDDLLA